MTPDTDGHPTITKRRFLEAAGATGLVSRACRKRRCRGVGGADRGRDGRLGLKYYDLQSP